MICMYIYTYEYDNTIWHTEVQSQHMFLFTDHCPEASERHPHRFESTRDALHSARLPSADLQKCRQRGGDCWLQNWHGVNQPNVEGISWVYSGYVSNSSMEIMKLYWQLLALDWTGNLNRKQWFLPCKWGCPLNFPLNQSNDLSRSKIRCNIVETTPPSSPFFLRWYGDDPKCGGWWHLFALIIFSWYHPTMFHRKIASSHYFSMIFPSFSRFIIMNHH